MKPEMIILENSIRLLEYWGFVLRAGSPMNHNYLWLKVCYDNPREDTTAYQTRWYGIPYMPSDWLNRDLHPTERKVFSRCIRSLADDGLVVTVARWGTRTSHFELTPKGLVQAIRLFPSDSDPLDFEAIVLALQHCKWATAEHIAAVPQEVSQ